jgi:GT2 family glycosyltransferase
VPRLEDSPRVLVGISTCNRADILAKALESAMSQSYPALRIAVVDDGSTDATPSISAAFPLVEWTRWSVNRGYAKARNHLMLQSDADYYVSLDDDAWFLLGDEIALAVGLLERDPAIAAVGFDILSPDRSHSVARQSPEPAAMFIGCGHVLRLEAVRRLSGYAAFPGPYGGEEKDLCLRLLDAGYHVVKMPGVHVWHDKSPTQRDVAAQHRSGVCNDLTLTLRRTPLVLLPFALGWKMVGHLRFAAKTRLLDQYIAGVRLALRSFPAIWRDRHPVRIRTLQRFSRLARG